MFARCSAVFGTRREERRLQKKAEALVELVFANRKPAAASGSVFKSFALSSRGWRLLYHRLGRPYGVPLGASEHCFYLLTDVFT